MGATDTWDGEDQRATSTIAGGGVS
jgi:hypothetical protein